MGGTPRRARAWCNQAILLAAGFCLSGQTFSASPAAGATASTATTATVAAAATTAGVAATATRTDAGQGAAAKAEPPKGDASRASPGKAGAAKGDSDPRTTSELALEYQRMTEAAEKATLCIFDPKCISSDRKVLDLFVQRRELLERIAARAEKGDLEAGYWRGAMAMEQGKRQMQRGEVQSDDLGSRKEAMYIAAVGAEEFRIAARFLKAPADKGMPEACDRLGEILALGMGVAPDVKRAADYYRCAGLGYLKEGRKDEAARVVGKMRGFLAGNHMYVVELYARLITREPSAPWRGPSQLASESGHMK